jgi:uncharacterized protein YjiS (DUF1127 family)
MRYELSCDAVCFIAPHQHQPTFSPVFSACCRRKEETPMWSSIIRLIRNRKQYARDVQELSRWSDRELADIGINRCDIHRIARGQSR